MRIISYLTIATLVASTSATSILDALGSSLNPNCANVKDEKLVVNDLKYGKISGCLCKDNLNYFLYTDSVARAAVIAQGISAVTSAIQNIISDSNKPVASCPSTPSLRKRSPIEIARSEHLCDFGLTKCGIYSSWSSKGGEPTTPYPGKKSGMTIHPYECLDVHTNLESCGGCVVPYTFGLTKEELKNLKRGVDCTTLRGVSDVGCYRGKCIIRKCRKGYELDLIHGDDGLLECVPAKGGKGDGAEGELHKQVGGTLLWKKDDEE